MKAIIAIICYDNESIKLFYNPKSIRGRMKEIKKQFICYIEFNNRIDARNFAADNLIEEKHLSKEKVKNIRTGKIHEFKVMDLLNISIRSDKEMKSFVDYYNKLP